MPEQSTRDTARRTSGDVTANASPPSAAAGVDLHGARAYVPSLVQRCVQEAGGSLTAARLDAFDGALLFADISGFTKLTERAAADGLEGTERLTTSLNGFFGKMITVIDAHGGDVVKFAGDALLTIWRRDDEGSLADAALRATACAVAVQAAVAGAKTAYGTPLSVKTAVSSGDLACAYVGGVWGRWEPVLFGPPLSQAGDAADDCEAGEVVLAPATAALLAERCLLTRSPSGAARVTGFRTPPLARPEATLPLSAEAAEAVWTFLPGAIRSRLRSGQAGWLAEMRQISVLFVTLPGHAGDLSLAESQDLMVDLQRLVYRVEGSVNKVSGDDKGLSFVAVLGMPPLAHEDDPRRALTLALDVRDLMRRRGYGCYIGVTTGRAFCGVIGSELRCEYTMIGDIVNLAARLMVASDGDVLCDLTTQTLAATSFHFVELEPLRLKGKAEPVRAFRPTGATEARADQADAPMVGRKVELQRLDAAVQRLDGGEGGLVVVGGAAGMGKSRLLTAFAGACDRALLHGAADAIDRSTPYVTWRRVLTALVDPGRDGAAVPLGAQVEAALAPLPEVAPLAPVISAILPLGLPETAVTRQLDGEARARAVHTVMIALLRRAASQRPVIVALEDTHWMDSASWALLQAVLDAGLPVLVTVWTRPEREIGVVERALLRAESTQLITLKPLNLRGTAALVRNILGATSLSEPLVELVHARAEGIPYFTGELTRSLRDGAHVVVQAGFAALADDSGALQLELPDTLHGVVAQRIDRLAPTAQLALKVASVVGRTFQGAAVDAAFPVDTAAEDLAQALGTLTERGLTTPLTSGTSSGAAQAWQFAHVTTQEVAYGLMLASQRRQLHSTVGAWLVAHRETLQTSPAVLAHHFEQAGDIDQAIAYTVEAGDQAMQRFANAEALRCFNAVLALCEQRGGSDDARLRAHCLLQIGAAHLGGHRASQSEEALRAGLALTGAPSPVKDLAALVRASGHVVLQLVRARWPSLVPKAAQDQRAWLQELARAHQRLTEVTYLRNWLPGMLYGSLRALDLAQRSRDRTTLAIAHSNLSVAASAAGLRRVGAYFERLALTNLAEVESLSIRAYVRFTTGMYRITVSDWAAAASAMTEVVEVAARLGDNRRLTDSLYGLTRLSERSGHLERSLQSAEHLYRVAQDLESPRPRIEALGALATLPNVADQATREQHLGELSALLHGLEGSDQLVHATWLVGWGRVARAHRQAGRHAAALTVATRVANELRSGAAAEISEVDAYVNAADVLLDQWELDGGDRALQERTRALCKAMTRYAKKYRNGRAMAWRRVARLHWVEGKRGKALKLWAAALATAAELQMPLEQLHAEVELAARLDADDPQRAALLRSASAHAAALGVPVPELGTPQRAPLG